MSDGTVMVICGVVVAAVSSLIFICLKIWLHAYGKRIKEELRKRYE